MLKITRTQFHPQMLFMISYALKYALKYLMILIRIFSDASPSVLVGAILSISEKRFVVGINPLHSEKVTPGGYSSVKMRKTSVCVWCVSALIMVW